MADSDSTVVVVAHFTTLPGKEHELAALLCGLVEPTRNEPGCLRYELNQEIENPRCFTFAEKFRDRPALEEHRNTPHVQHLRANSGELVESRSLRLHREILPASGGGVIPVVQESQIVVIAHFTAKPGREAELSTFLQSLVAPTREEPGCLRYEVNQDLEDPGTFTFVETFADREAFDAHCSMPYIGKLFEKLPLLVEKQYIGLHRPL